MFQLSLNHIPRISPFFAAAEAKLDLIPLPLPKRELVPDSAITLLIKMSLIVITKKTRECVGNTSLYAWLKAHMPPDTKVWCIELDERTVKKNPLQLVLLERLVMPGFFQITPDQIRRLYHQLPDSREDWHHGYRSYADLCRMLGVKVLKGSGDKV